MKDFKYILFDLDGTLLDSGEGIINGLKYGLKLHGIDEQDMAVLKTFVGPPLVQHLMDVYGFSEDEARAVVVDFRKYYEPKGVFENRVYDDIPELLTQLRQMGRRIMVATSKPEFLAHKILEQRSLKKYFDFIGGSVMDLKRTTKAEVIQYVLAENGINEVNFKELVMIGDTKYDIIGAKKFNIATIGVTYGYGSRKELEEAGADCIVDSPQEVFRMLQNK